MDPEASRIKMRFSAGEGEVAICSARAATEKPVRIVRPIMVMRYADFRYSFIAPPVF